MGLQLETPGDVVDALGGTGAIARLTGFKYQRVWNWRKRGFPAETYDILTRALNERGLIAPVSLWKQVEASE